MKLVTVLGGYGVFGSRIATALAGHASTQIRIAGRRKEVGERFAAKIGVEFSPCDHTEIASLDRTIDGSFLVVHAAGPFQNADYRVAERCIARKVHYLDIADGRDFVCGIDTLDRAARERDCFVTSGASSVPAITHAMISELRSLFQQIDEIRIALSPGNRNPRGASTVAAIMTYVGRPIRVWSEQRWEVRTGWSRAERANFPTPVGSRSVYDCDAPDLELFPKCFDAATVRFQAGLELTILNWLIAGLSRMRAAGLISRLPRYARFLANSSKLLLPFGSRCGALGVWVRGQAHSKSHERQIALVTDWDGPAIPTAPAIMLAKKLLDQGPSAAGAFPCLGLFCLKELADFLRNHRAWLISGTGGVWDETPFDTLG